MATIGLDRLYYAKITENDAGEETYGTPEQLAKAISADLSVELAEATLYADDGASEIVKEFKSGTLSLGIDDIGSTAASDLTGATIDKNKVLISASEDGGDPVAVGFRAKKSNGKYNDTAADQAFRIYRITKPLNGIVTIYGQHISYDLANVPVLPFSTESRSPQLILSQLLAGDTRFTGRTDYSDAKAYLMGSKKVLRGRKGQPRLFQFPRLRQGSRWGACYQ